MANKGRLGSLSRRADFLRLRDHGRRLQVTPWLIVNVQASEGQVLRVGWTLSRHVGSAVVRNRLRRWGREFFRAWQRDAQASLDMNLIFRRREEDFYKSLTHKELDRVLAKLVDRIEKMDLTRSE